MLQCKGLLLTLLLHLVSVEGGFTYDLSNWLIFPANLRANLESDNDFGSVRFNRSELVQKYREIRHTDPYIMSVRGFGQRNNQRQKKVESKSNDYSSDDLAVPLGRAIETVKNFCTIVSEFFSEDDDLANEGRASATGSTRKIKKAKKKYKKFLLPLLIAYKLKFLTLVPLLIGGMILLVGTTGLAGFFFALFTAVMSLKSENKLEIKKW